MNRVFTPKYRYKDIYRKLRGDIGKILRKLCENKDAEVLEATGMFRCIHLVVMIPQKKGGKFYEICKRKKYFDNI